MSVPSKSSKSVTVRLKVELVDFLENLAKATNTPRSELVRNAAEAFYAEQMKSA